MKKKKISGHLVKVCRASGMPVDIKNIDRYKEDYGKIYDKLMLKYKLTDTTIITPELSQKLDKILLRVQRILSARYPNIGYWKQIQNKLQWRIKVKQHGPIAVARDMESGDIVYVILDAGFPG
jgi:hypothetical protein